MDFQTLSAVFFLVALTFFVYLKRKNLETKQIIPHVLYFSMYKTTWGLRFMDSISKRYRKILVYIGNIGILVGFLGMIFIGFMLVVSLISFFTEPEAAAPVGFVLPFKAKGIFFVPFFYWIISIFVIAAVHEFAHGLIARANNLKVKSSGFAFIGLLIPIIPAAFVEPDEKELKKRPYKEQLSVFAAGPLSNILLGFVFFGVFLLLSNLLVPLDGVKIVKYAEGDKIYPIESSGIILGEIIYGIDGMPTPYVDNLTYIMKTKKPGELVKLKTDKSEYKLILAKNPVNESVGYLGGHFEQNFRIKYKNISHGLAKGAFLWITGLVYWLYFLNFGIGLFNLAPIGPLDGGRMIQLALHKIFGAEKGNKVWRNIGIFFGLIILLFIMIGFYNILSDIFGRLFVFIK